MPSIFLKLLDLNLDCLLPDEYFLLKPLPPFLNNFLNLLVSIANSLESSSKLEELCSLDDPLLLEFTLTAKGYLFFSVSSTLLRFSSYVIKEPMSSSIVFLTRFLDSYTAVALVCQIKVRDISIFLTSSYSL